MPARLQHLRDEDLETGNAAESDAFVRLQGQLRSGTLVEGDDEVSLNGEREKTIRRVLR
jgi:hypothetical protein